MNFDDLEGEFAAYYTDTCGFDVSVDIDGWFMIIPIDAAGKGRRQPVELNIFHIPGITFTSDDRSFTTPLDVGPDVYYLDNGVLMVALTGRSTTGSGVIGRVVIDTTTGDVVFDAGRRVFDDIDTTICEALAPGS